MHRYLTKINFSHTWGAKIDVIISRRNDAPLLLVIGLRDFPLKRILKGESFFTLFSFKSESCEKDNATHAGSLYFCPPPQSVDAREEREAAHRVPREESERGSRNSLAIGRDRCVARVRGWRTKEGGRPTEK